MFALLKIYEDIGGDQVHYRPSHSFRSFFRKATPSYCDLLQQTGCLNKCIGHISFSNRSYIQ